MPYPHFAVGSDGWFMLIIAALALAIWVYLLALRGGFWLNTVGDDSVAPTMSAAPLSEYPRIVAVIPARNEAESIAASLGSLLKQDYPGPFSIVLVDDNSDDRTGEIARGVAQDHPAIPVTILWGRPLPQGWTGKLWAVRQGIAEAAKAEPDYLLLTDADIVYEPGVLSWLAGHSVRNGNVLTSLMAKLRCQSFAERAFIPAFIYFFQMLYPFAWVNDRRRRMAAAAGGCMLVKADVLARAGGIDAIRDALIDDCTLGQTLKRQGSIWLGLTDRVHSIRVSDRIADIHAMVSRSAYAQLRYSPLLLAGTIVGMALTYVAAPVAVLSGDLGAQLLGLAAWGLMAVTFWPTLRFYGLSPLWGLALPAIAGAYMAFTISSGIQHSLGRGGRWKGRNQAKRTA
jgi:hopene-associated glycosyltransferase HpnB